MHRPVRTLLAACLLLLCVTAPAWASETAGAGGEGQMTHRMMMLAMQLGLILFAARLGGIVFNRLRLPHVLGELCAGVLIGPHALGHLPIPRLFPHGLIPEQAGFAVSPELYAFCSVAAIVLLFMVGLETDIKMFLRYSLAGSLVGVGGVILSFLVGDLIGVMFAPMLFGEPRGFFSPACLFLGVISTATSVGITARVLSEKKELDSPEGVTILAGAVVDDVLGIIMLAVGLGVIAASAGSGRVDWGHIGVIAFKAVAIWLAATVAGIAASRQIGRLLKAFRDRSHIAMMALGLALVLAAMFEEAGLAMIIGAYVMGLSLSRTDISHLIRETLEPLYAFLVPIFFVVMGMLVDVRLIASGPVLIFGSIYTGTAILAKLLGCGLPALAAGFTPRGAMRVGLGMLPRGEVALIVAGIGMAAGILPPQIFGVGVLMTLVTTLVAPPALVWAFRSGGTGVRGRQARPVAEQESVRFEFPSDEAAEMIAARIFGVFENEGYFVHAISHEDGLYQFRKDTQSIGFCHQGAAIRFDCAPGVVPFVNAAMLDVVADFEHTLRALHAPINARDIARRVQDASNGAGFHSSRVVARHLSPALCVPDLEAADKRGIVSALLDRLVAEKQLKAADRDKALEAVLEREASMSTGMQHGVAVPHARTDLVDRLLAVVGICREGVDFDSLDGAPSRIFVLTLSPRQASSPHVQFMATIGQLLDEEGRNRVLGCRTPAELWSALTREPGRPS